MGSQVLIGWQYPPREVHCVRTGHMACCSLLSARETGQSVSGMLARNESVQLGKQPGPVNLLVEKTHAHRCAQARVQRRTR